MDWIDIELFASEVQKRSALWDPNHKDFKNRKMKYELWSEVSAILFADYADMNDQERLLTNEKVYKRWRHLKDSYVRNLREISRKKKPIKRYLYSNHLKFLGDVYSYERGVVKICVPLSPNLNYFNEMVDDSDTEQYEEKGNKVSLRNSTKAKRGSDITKAKDMNKKIKIQTSKRNDKNGNNEESPNEDLEFFRTLLPYLEQLRSDKKLKFRVDVMNLLVSYTKSSLVKSQNTDESNLESD